MLVLDHIHQRMHVGLPDETSLPNGQKFDLLSLALLGVRDPQAADQLQRVSARLAELKVDVNDYICLKFLILLNPGECFQFVYFGLNLYSNFSEFFSLLCFEEVRGLTNFKLVQEAHEKTKQALLEYTINFYPQIAVIT